jgi:hypothetical protein
VAARRPAAAALVHVRAGLAIAGEPRDARACKRTRGVVASGVARTRVGACLALVRITALHAVAGPPVVEGAGERPGRVRTRRLLAAGGQPLCALVHVLARPRAIARCTESSCKKKKEKEKERKEERKREKKKKKERKINKISTKRMLHNFAFDFFFSFSPSFFLIFFFFFSHAAFFQQYYCL